jgi:hypothetical protein
MDVRDKRSVGQKIMIKSFNGSFSGPEDVKQNENYWILIGRYGIVVQTIADVGVAKDRVLVKLNNNVKALGLECHNKIENSLWIRLSELEFLT